MNIITINPRDCTRWECADRSGFEFGDLYALAKDIQKNGQIEPIIVRPIKGGGSKYQVIAGSRRWKACLDNDLPLKAVVKDLNDEEAFLTQIKENEKKPICDYSKGLSFQKALDTGSITVSKLAEVSGFSQRKIYNFLTFNKVPERIWEAVQNMTRVSSKTAAAIYELSNKGDGYIKALIELADDIRKGAGAKSIESKVLLAVLGEDALFDPFEKIKLDDGQVIGKWAKNGIIFEKGLSFNQNELSDTLKQYFESSK